MMKNMIGKKSHLEIKMSFKDLWKQYLETGQDQTEPAIGFGSRWKQFIYESEQHNLETVYNPEEVAQPEALSPAEIPAELYHATRPPLLSSIAELGLRDYSDHSRHGAGQNGVSFATELDPLSGGAFGNLVLVFDGSALAATGQFEFRSHQDPTIDTPEAEVRVTMADSAADSGSGIDAKVDALGTLIPFHFCKKLIFLYKLPKFELKWLQENFPGVEIQIYKKEQNQEA